MRNNTKAWRVTDDECDRSAIERLTEITQECVHPVEMTITDTRMYEENLLLQFKTRNPKRSKKKIN